MLQSMQTLVRRQFHPLIMSMIAGGFLLLLVELVLYQHYESLQLLGMGAVVIGLIASLLGIGARGSLRTALIVVFLVVSLSGVLGLWFHNVERIGGGARISGGEESEEGEGEMSPPVLASLSVSGLCVFGATMLLARRDDD
jgi:hypothetical protein